MGVPVELVGRTRTVDGAVHGVRERAIRRLLVTGRVGVGKTALAVAVAEQLTPDPVVVAVDGAADAQEVFVRLGRTMGVTEAGHRIRRVVVGSLCERRAVLVLDGCEEWSSVEPVVDNLLAACEGLVVLLTARRPPAGADIEVLHLQPLAVPTVDDRSAEVLRRNPAVRLFVDRARAVNPTFEPDDEDLRTIGELSRRLDGLPLALVLAASRISLMQPDAMLREMHRVGPWRLVGLSLRDELTRSIEHLDDAGRRTFVALAVFVGGATVDALHAVSGLPELADTVEALDGLVELDLVSVDRARARYALSSAAASYVADAGPGADQDGGHHGAADQDRVLRARHADHFARRARERAHRADHGDRAVDRDLAIDHGNRLAAVGWLQETGDHDGALRVLVDMAADFDRRGEPGAGCHLLRGALANTTGVDPRAEAEAHLWVARFVAESPDPVDHRAAVEHLLAARSLAEASGHVPTVLAVLLAICENHTLLRSFDLADDAIADGLARTGGGRHPVAEVGFLTWQAVTMHQRGDDSTAASVCAAAINKAVALDDRRLIVRSCLVFLGLPSAVRAGVVTDSPSPSELVEMARADADVRGEGWVLALIAGNAADDGDPVAAAVAGRALLALAVRRANAPLGRLGLALVVRLVVSTDDEELGASIAGALDRFGPVMEASMAPHTYDSYRRAVAAIERSLGPERNARWRDRGRAESWGALIASADAFLARVVDGSVRAGAGSVPVADLLSPREADVLAGLVAGSTNKEIAAELGLRPKTVMHHCAAIYRKLDVSGRAGAVAAALQSGFVPR